MSAKMKKYPLEKSNNKLKPYSEFHFDLSGPLNPSLGGKVYSAHFMGPLSSKTDVVYIKKKSDLPDSIISYVKMVEENFSQER